MALMHNWMMNNNEEGKELTEGEDWKILLLRGTKLALVYVNTEIFGGITANTNFNICRLRLLPFCLTFYSWVFINTFMSSIWYHHLSVSQPSLQPVSYVLLNSRLFTQGPIPSPYCSRLLCVHQMINDKW